MTTKKKKPAKKLPTKLIKHLNSKGAKHNVLEHKTVYTAIDAANTLKRKMDEIVKSLFVRADKYYFLVCLPADRNLDFKKLKKVIENEVGTKVKTVEIPSEKVMRKFLKIKNEGLSGFGTFYKLPVIIDKQLGKVKKAVFSAGDFNHSVEMLVRDFIKLENAILGSFGIKKKIKIVDKKSSSPKKKKSGKKTVAKKKQTRKKKTGSKRK